ncbi:hypothetical protein QZH41_007483 [Actinostola sp. cb2023]|nr:hypothetical protein QZH41_007483 [Actinostola sp. cb2023]
MEAMSVPKTAKETTTNEINRIHENPKRGDRYKRGDNRCYRCGGTGHYGRDPSCPARGKTCRECGGRDHFASQCKSRSSSSRSHGNQDKKPNRNTANAVQTDEEEAYAFSVCDNKQEKIPVIVGGCEISMIVDSGASANILDRQTWEWLKRNKIKCESARSSRKLYTYGSEKPP